MDPEKVEVRRGRVHKYLDMNLDYSLNIQVNITMLYYIKEVTDVKISRTSFKSSLKLTFCCWKPC